MEKKMETIISGLLFGSIPSFLASHRSDEGYVYRGYRGYIGVHIAWGLGFGASIYLGVSQIEGLW